MSSLLLNKEENDKLFKTVGARCQTQASAVVQVYITEAPSFNNWVKRHCGVATFTKDNSRKSYFIQVFDIVMQMGLFEQELYNQFKYHASSNTFHQFEGDTGVVGLQFADTREAESFNKVVQARIAMKERKKQERRQRLEKQSNSNSQSVLSNPSARTTSQSATNLNQMQSLSTSNLGSRKLRRSKLTKDDISSPSNFKHITHYDLVHGLCQLNMRDEQLEHFFNMAGVKATDLKNGSTRNFIYSFIEENGGIEKAKQESVQNLQGSGSMPPRPVPTNHCFAPPPKNLTASRAPPPPPPPRTPHLIPAPAIPSQQRLHDDARPGHNNKPKSPALGVAPPPPPALSVAPPPPPALSVAPPPPPPPPLSVAPPPPPPPPIAKLTSNAAPTSHNPPPSGGKSNLLKEIEQGISLKKVEATEVAGATDSQSALLKQIRKGIQLKSVDKSQKNSYSSTNDDVTSNTMATMLMAALATRKAAVNSSDSEDSDQTTSDDEWDDD